MLYTLQSLLLLLSPISAFSVGIGHQCGGVRCSPSRHGLVVAAEDPTANPFIQLINQFQEAIQDSPAAKFKRGLAKLQAGEYDESSINAKLDNLIGQPAVMFSFTT